MSDDRIEIQPTPNPNALKFSLDRPTTDGGPRTYRTAEDAGDNAAAMALIAIDGVVNVFMTANFISINKSPEADWDTIVPMATEAIKAGYFSD
jgi:hypothetical protein